ncbi:hypothetical protein BaRGS_00014848, partial [Batillaria attramentaria]
DLGKREELSNCVNRHPFSRTPCSTLIFCASCERRKGEGTGEGVAVGEWEDTWFDVRFTRPSSLSPLMWLTCLVQLISSQRQSAACSTNTACDVAVCETLIGHGKPRGQTNRSLVSNRAPSPVSVWSWLLFTDTRSMLPVGKKSLDWGQKRRRVPDLDRVDLEYLLVPLSLTPLARQSQRPQDDGGLTLECDASGCRMRSPFHAALTEHSNSLSTDSVRLLLGKPFKVTIQGRRHYRDYGFCCTLFSTDCWPSLLEDCAFVSFGTSFVILRFVILRSGEGGSTIGPSCDISRTWSVGNSSDGDVMASKIGENVCGFHVISNVSSNCWDNVAGAGGNENALMARHGNTRHYWRGMRLTKRAIELQSA